MKWIDLGIKLPPLQPRKGLWQLAVEVCQEMDVHLKEMKSLNRKKEFVNARKEFSARAYHQYNYNMTQISNFLGHKDHTSVHHYLRGKNNE